MPSWSQILYVVVLWGGLSLFGNVATQILKTPLRIFWKRKALLKRRQPRSLRLDVPPYPHRSVRHYRAGDARMAGIRLPGVGAYPGLYRRLV